MVNALIYTLSIATITALLLVAGLALAERTHNRAKYILILLCISVSGLLVDALPPELPPPRLYEVIGKFLSAPNIGLIWWFGLSLLDDKFRLGPIAWAGMALPTFMLLFVFLGDVCLAPRPQPAYGYALDLIQLILVLHVIWVCISGFGDDLINARRNMRIWFAVLPAAVLLVLVVAGTIFTGYTVVLFRVMFTLPVAVFGLFWLTRFQMSQLDFAPDSGSSQEISEIRPEDHAAHTRLLQIMEEEKAYLQPDLTVGRLAEQVGVAPHQLRALINRGMGYRNFSQFLASYRIADIKAALADPEQARVPVLTIALNNGFSSLTTFNRTFRSETGQSAAAFRKDELSKQTQS